MSSDSKNETQVILVRCIDTNPAVLDNPNFSCKSYVIEDGRNFLFKR